MNKPIHTLLIANRGEIARRIIRTCRKMGIRSVAVFSEADRQAPFVREADTAYYLRENQPAASYLNMEKLIEAARHTEADAVHPGYGFLSENAAFARLCIKEGLTFVGPTPETIALMGSKSQAKNLMQAHGVPVIPGFESEDDSVNTWRSAAETIGFPVLIKASAGGGGKGMRVAYTSDEFIPAFEAARREAEQAFGDGKLLLEKYFLHARHIEFQIFGDSRGKVLHLLERECSVQRRYQKIIEESPSPVMDEKLREQMGLAALKAAEALNYQNAGTVEFILTDEDEFYFLEVNTRLQVEHPVTEAVTGLDLVQLQIEVAEGKPLSINQEDIQPKGYAIECRLYAEDAENQFIPATGKVLKWQVPDVEGLRVDSGVVSGSEVTIHYDPMLAKLIVHANDRTEALRKMRYTLTHLQCLGITTNQDFLNRLLSDEAFQKGEYHTRLLDDRPDLLKGNEEVLKRRDVLALALTLYRWSKRQSQRKLIPSLPSGWRNNFYMPQQERYLIDDELMNVQYRHQDGIFEMTIDDCVHTVSLSEIYDEKVSFFFENELYHVRLVQNKEEYFLRHAVLGALKFIVPDRYPEKESEKLAGGYEAPMPSEVIEVLVKEGEEVVAGQPLVILSSMKMENTLKASETGTVEAVYVRKGAYIGAGHLLLKMEESKATEELV